MTVDILNATKKIAIEVQGKQHTEFNKFFHNNSRADYLNGIKMSEPEYKDALRRREGLPWYKGSSANARF